MAHHGGAEGGQSQSGTKGLTGQGRAMVLETRREARGSASQHRAGGEVVQGGADKLDGVSDASRAEELRGTSGA